MLGLLKLYGVGTENHDVGDDGFRSSMTGVGLSPWGASRRKLRANTAARFLYFLDILGVSFSVDGLNFVLVFGYFIAA